MPLIWYMAHPYGGDPQNLERAKRWLAWLQAQLTGAVVIAPWIAACERHPEHDADPALREAAIQWDEENVRACDGVILVGGRITEGMAREAAAARHVWDRTSLGEEPPV